MQLAVGVEDRTGVHQFLQVRTRKSAPLHASLENTLQQPLYWYDIIGPQHNINWSTPSGQLQVSLSSSAVVTVFIIIVIAALSCSLFSILSLICPFSLYSYPSSSTSLSLSPSLKEKLFWSELIYVSVAVSYHFCFSSSMF